MFFVHCIIHSPDVRQVSPNSLVTWMNIGLGRRPSARCSPPATKLACSFPAWAPSRLNKLECPCHQHTRMTSNILSIKRMGQTGSHASSLSFCHAEGARNHECGPVQLPMYWVRQHYYQACLLSYRSSQGLPVELLVLRQVHMRAFQVSIYIIRLILW